MNRRIESPWIRKNPDLLGLVLLGFPPLRRRQSRLSFFERCGLRAVECAGIDSAIEVVQSLIVHAVVLDGHAGELRDLSAPLVKLLAVCRRAEPIKPRLFLMSAGALTTPARDLYDIAGSIVIPPHLQTLRGLTRLVRTECGLPDDCCVAGSNGTLVVRQTRLNAGSSSLARPAHDARRGLVGP